jgi:hypothetical protein
MSLRGLSIAPKTIANFLKRITPHSLVTSFGDKGMLKLGIFI